MPCLCVPLGACVCAWKARLLYSSSNIRRWTVGEPQRLHMRIRSSPKYIMDIVVVWIVWKREHQEKEIPEGALLRTIIIISVIAIIVHIIIESHWQTNENRITSHFCLPVCLCVWVCVRPQIYVYCIHIEIETHVVYTQRIKWACVSSGCFRSTALSLGVFSENKVHLSHRLMQRLLFNAHGM